MSEQERFDRLVARYPHPHRCFFDRPHFTRRRFFQIAGAGVTGAFLAGRAKAVDVSLQQVSMKGTAKNVVFILLAGAPSHIDTFDLKVIDGVTPSNFNADKVKGLGDFPTGLLPKIAERAGSIAIVRSMRSWALAHSLGQRWTQIGRNPSAALGDIAPNIGSIVAIEKDPERRVDQVFPAFVALNSAGAVENGYLPSNYAPLKTSPSTAGLQDIKNPDAARMEGRWSQLRLLDGPLRTNSPLGRPVEDFDKFDAAARALMNNPVVDRAFAYAAADSARYGNTSFGNACLVAKQILAADQGTRFIEISLGGWDMHQDIYGKNNPRGNNLYTLGKTLDDGFSALLDDLDAAGLLSQTLIVMVGEFGRTVGKLTAQLGRDHFLQQFAVFAGGGVKGGQALGATDDSGSDTVDYGWSRNRYVRPEDIEATIYSAMNINWTTVRRDDPFGRGFEYVPFSGQDLYGPVNELWG